MIPNVIALNVLTTLTNLNAEQAVLDLFCNKIHGNALSNDMSLMHAMQQKVRSTVTAPLRAAETRNQQVEKETVHQHHEEQNHLRKFLVKAQKGSLGAPTRRAW